jgi:uncharacterized protein (UPF0335 family)
MAFEAEIDTYERYGSYSYSFDKYGNIVLNASSSMFSQVYLSLPLNIFQYESRKIESFYQPKFEEFIPTPITSPSASVSLDVQVQEKNESLAKLELENAELKSQLKTVISEAEQNGSAAEAESIRQVIVDLRISLGEGNTQDDFDLEFPYPAKTDVEVIPETETS